MYLLLAILLVPIVEIALFIQVGGLIGLWPTLGIIVATAVLGTVLMRTQGFAVLARAQAAMGRGDLPVGEVFDGACVLLGGLLLLLPGFFTDVLGILLLIPPLRRWVGRRAMAWLLRNGRVQVWATAETRRTGPVVIDGEFRELGADPARLPRSDSHEPPPGRRA
ncbi:FxsA family protein [Arenibaculum pallidiluteum]|uniref:FxsA family protein n=1 Tax=Arenibaculum pallidiluteum TaxID=2812559 RepID=UPI001A96C9CD|nr:FxsA family protein [Arenibaculum pallidiluteum]